MEIADERRRGTRVEHALPDFGYRLRRFRQVHGHANHLGAGLGQLDALLRRCRRIGRIRHRHRLHHDGSAAPDLDRSDANADGLVKPDTCHAVLRLYTPALRCPPSAIRRRPPGTGSGLGHCGAKQNLNSCSCAHGTRNSSLPFAVQSSSCAAGPTICARLVSYCIRI